MNNDLISREALREDLRRFFPAEVLEGIEPKTLFAQIMHDIDNAPTVEIPTELCKGCRFLKDCETCEEKLRPQGEWEKCQNDMFRCSICRQADEVPTSMGIPIYNFCPNCGADMRGEV